MKLASLKNGRDGKLVVVSTDLAWYASADMIAPTLQAALDNWDRVEADLRNLATDLDHEVIPRERFHERLAAAPLPRAYQWADGSAYVNHVALVRQARGAEMPDSFWELKFTETPLAYSTIASHIFHNKLFQITILHSDFFSYNTKHAEIKMKDQNYKLK